MNDTHENKQEVPLPLHKDNLSSSALNLKDEHVSSSLGLFIIHNVVRRNIQTCLTHAPKIDKSTSAPFLTYARYTIFTAEDQLDAVDTIWFPAFAHQNPAFNTQISAHADIRVKTSAVKSALDTAEHDADNSDKWTAVATALADLQPALEQTYDVEEDLSNQLGHSVPMSMIKDLEKQQEARRKQAVKTYGHLWCACYLLKSMSPAERGIFPPGLPKLVANGMMSGGALQYRREFVYAPKF